MLRSNAPFCDIDGAVAGAPGTCIAVDCEPLSFHSCRAEATALECNSAGDSYVESHCDFGCDMQLGCKLETCDPGSLDCLPTLIPHFVPNACDSLSLLPDLVVDATIDIDTSNASTCTGGILQQANGLEVCVVHAPSIHIVADAILKVRGTRALALLADLDVLVDGVLDASADTSVAGPGGAHFMSGANTGGAGFATAGGSGSSGEAVVGAARIDPATTDEMVAGSFATNVNTRDYSSNGRGGGGVLIVGCRGTVSVQGRIDAGGGGGKGGTHTGTGHYGGAGGSGGYVVLQGMTVSVSGAIFANGGGGGAGAAPYLAPVPPPAQSGQDGALSSTLTHTEGVGEGGDGSGGVGGQGLALPPSQGLGADASCSACRGGGGGGSAGMIQIFTPTNALPVTANATVSPAFQPHRSVQTK